MQLDHTNIAIRERGPLETMDMALQMTFRHIGPLLVLTTIGCLPWAILNQWLLGWMIAVPDADQPFTSEQLINSIRYIWTMLLMVFLQAQWATMLATTYLGQVVFTDRPRLKDLVRETRKVFWRVLFCQGIVRCVLFAVLLAWIIDPSEPYSASEFWLVVLAFAICWVRSIRPFIDEILLLERNPLRGSNVQTAARRSAMLHGPAVGDSMGRWLLSATTNFLLFFSLFGTSMFISGTFLYDWTIGPFMLAVNFPIVLWLLVMFSAVVRFLNYLDVRIRQEGWEVELRLRAEAVRLTRALT